MSIATQNEFEKANLTIKVPHWLVQVRIFNELSELVETINEFELIEPERYYVAEIELEPGIYEIEYSLGEKADRRMAIIQPGENINALEKKSRSWKNLQVASSIPLETNNAAQKKYSNYTENRSLIKTRSSISAENSSIFLSLKIPKKYAGLFPPEASLTGLQDIFDLKDGQGNSVIDFSKDLEFSKTESNIIFSADLPHGYYIFEWVSYVQKKPPKNIHKKAVCYQPIFLHRNWTTQVFVSTHSNSEKAFSLNMARYGMSFQKSDETIIAAEAVLDTLSQEIGRSMINKRHMGLLISGELQNPWLGILAAYALIPLDNVFFYEKGTEGTDKTKELYEEIKAFLKRELPDHPDVCALDLKPGEVAGKPFEFPPLLKIGFKRVQAHAINHELTIPCETLTDQILNTPLINGPWVSWEKWYDLSGNSLPESEISSGIQHEPGKESEVMQDFFRIKSSPKLPIYQLMSEQVPNEYFASTGATTLQEFTLLNLSQELLKTGNSYQELPTQININPEASLNNFLVNLQAKDISLATNMPLFRINTSLKNIRAKKEKFLNEGKLTEDEKQVIQYAFREESKKTAKNEQSARLVNSPVADPVINNVSDTAYYEDEPDFITIEQCVVKLQEEAHRLLTGFKRSAGSLKKKAKGFAKKLLAIADKLLQRADFTAKTNIEGKIVFANGAFLNLILPPPVYSIIKSKNTKGKENIEITAMNQSSWEEVIAVSPAGNSIITAPVRNNYFGQWNLKKVALYNEEEKTMQGQLIVLRGVGALDCDPQLLLKIQEQLGKLSLYGPLFGIKFSEKEKIYEEHLVKIITELENLITE